MAYACLSCGKNRPLFLLILNCTYFSANDTKATSSTSRKTRRAFKGMTFIALISCLTLNSRLVLLVLVRLMV